MSDSLTITGKVIAKGEHMDGVSSNGPWEFQQYILESEGKYPKSVPFKVWGENIAKFGIRGNDTVTISFEIEGKKPKDRWFTEIRAWKCEGGSGVGNASPQQQAAPPPVQQPPEPPPADNFDNDVPF